MKKRPKKKKEKAREEKQVEAPVKKIKIKVIGIGNGGGAIVADIAPSVKRVKFLAANTDRLALAKLKRKVEIFQFGQNVTAGFGTGMDVAMGQLAAEKEKEKIEKVLKGCDLCILVSCLGGGTGSGASPVFAKISRRLGSLTYGIFTLPFNFEGKKKLEIAKESLKRLKPFVNVITIVPNERIFKIVDKKLPLREALFTINKILAFSLEGLIKTVYNPGIINIDFADLKTILKGRGAIAYLSRAEARGEGRAKKVQQLVLSNPLYPYDVLRAKRVLFNISGPPNLSISEVSEISQGIFNSVRKDAKIIFGVSRESDVEKVEISLLAVGCEMKNLFPPSVKKTAKRALVKTRKKKEPVEVKAQVKQKPKVPRNKKEILKSKIRKRQQSPLANTTKEKIRKNALQLQKDIEALEKD